MNIARSLAVALAIAASPVISDRAEAKSHSPAARALTLAQLSVQIENACPEGFFPRLLGNRPEQCDRLVELEGDLYNNPEVATKADLETLDKIRELGGEIINLESGVREDLVAAIENAQTRFAHVVNDHGGRWETEDQKEICLPGQNNG